MPGSPAPPTDFFLAEFGNAELSSRLWRGGLRADSKGYTCVSGPRSISNALKDGLDIRITDGLVEALINELETCWNDPARMRRACTVMNDDGRQTPLSLSLVKLVLCIDLFQPHMVTCVVNKISEFGEESHGEGDIAKLLLNQLRWLDFIVDGTALCENLLAIVPVVSPHLQRTLIEALPEILDDASRSVAVTELVKILAESPSMMGSVVDALAALGVDDDLLPDVNSSILSTLNAANGHMLPVSLKYLLRTCPQPLLPRTIQAMRQTLALPGLGAAAGRLCLDAVRAGLRMTKLVADYTIKILKEIETPLDHKPADVWILIALLDSPMHRKPAEVVFRKKAAKKMFSKALLHAALAPFAESFDGLTGRLFEMGSIAIRGSELGARQTGVVLYALLFRLFPSGSTRRNVVTALLDHVGTRKGLEMDAALESLVVIAMEGEGDRSLLPHSASIQGLLDFLEFFSDSQLRQIWTILGFLCRASSCKPRRAAASSSKKKGERTSGNPPLIESIDEGEDETESELAMLEILLRKELTHPDVFYRRIGVLGACTMIKVLGSSVRNNILKMLLEVGRAHPLSQALAFDELAQVFGDGSSTSKETAESIRKKISTLFENKYITECAGLGPLTKLEELLPATFFGNLEGEDVEFCFSISKLVRDERTLQESQDAIRAMVPNLRLLCVMTSSCFDGSLAEVDATIGAPLHIPVFPQDQDFSELTTRAKGDLLLSLFIAHGWIVELLNGFAGQENGEIRGKCVRRVDELLTLSAQIPTCISSVPLWKEVLFDAYNGSQSISHGLMHRPDSKYGKGGKGNRISRDGKDQQSTGMSQRNQEWSSLARQLSPSALSLIRITDPITWRITETETEFGCEGNPTTETVKLSSKGLLFLLSELAAHVDTLVNGELRDSNSFCVTLFRSSGSKSDKMKNTLESGTDGRLKKFRALRISLSALGPQLARCMKNFLPSSDEDGMDDDTTVEMHRNSIRLCLRSLALSLNSKTLSDCMAADLLFTILASIRLDGSTPVEASDPFTSADIQIAAKVACKQLRQSLLEVLSLDESEVPSEGSTGCASQVGLQGCCAFLAAMDSTFYFCADLDKANLGPKLSKAAYFLLKHGWDIATLRSKKTQKLIPGIVKLYIQNAPNPFKALEELSEEVVKFTVKQTELAHRSVDTQDINGTVDENRSELGALTEQTCNAFSVAILEQYIWLFKRFQPRKFNTPEEAMERMHGFIRAELPLYTMARQNQRLLGPVMRAGRALVDIFLKSCLPFLKDHYMEHRSSVVRTCKAHQKPTRILQTFCAHSKYTRDTSLTGLVPPLRKSLELLLYRVKDLLTANNAVDAFQMGNLKHRDINGEVLGSQHLQYKSESEGESESDEDSGGDEQDDAVEEAAAISSKMKKSRSRKSARPQLVKFRGQGQKKNATTNKKGRQPVQLKKKDQSRTPRNKKNGEADNNIDEVRAEASAASDAEPEEHSAGEAEDKISSVHVAERAHRARAESSKGRKRRNPLIDDEAEGSEDEEEDALEDENLSQFLDFGDVEDE